MDNKILIKVDKDGRIRDEVGYGKLLWSNWMATLGIKPDSVGYLTFTPCDPKEFNPIRE